MFGSHHYAPILHGKEGEFRALRQLSGVYKLVVYLIS